MLIHHFTYTGKVSLLLLGAFLIGTLARAQKTYQVEYDLTDKDTTHSERPPGLKDHFDSRIQALEYIQHLPAALITKGYAAASVDSVQMDSTSARVWLFAGKQYQWGTLYTDSIPHETLQALRWTDASFKKNFSYAQLNHWQEELLEYYENRGYPFAEVQFKNIRFDSGSISGMLDVQKGVQYRIDSIRVFGKAKISNKYLQHYLHIFEGDIYDRSKLAQVSKLMSELPFLEETQPWDLTMLGTGATLNLYLQPRRSSEVNVLIGFMPGNTITGKAQVTADVHLNLKNTLGAGESILLNWQQLQAQSPRLDLGYNHPYIFDSHFGIDLSFGLLKKDSSWLQLDGMLGIQYLISASQYLKVFYQSKQSRLLQGSIDTAQIIRYRKLPPIMDIRSGNFGLGYHFEKLDYRLNPRKGFQIDLVGSAGLKRVNKSNDILDLKDPAEPGFDFGSLYDTIKLKSYRFTLTADLARYFPAGKSTVVMLGVRSGWLQSPQTFQNELFRIGGSKILRGFDEESIYANRYGVFTAEYRYLVGRNSFFYGFVDLGLTGTRYSGISYSNSFVSTGLGLEFETKAGLLHITFAIGKRNDVKFDFRNASKIHFGYINYF